MTKENHCIGKRKRVLAAVSQEIVTSEDDDNVADGMDICNIIENKIDQRRKPASSCDLHALGETIRNTLLEINEIRERNRERRHRELLQILTKMVEQENTTKCEFNNSRITNLSSVSQDVPTNEYVAEQSFVEKDFSTANIVTNDGSSSGNMANNLDYNHITSKTMKNNSPNYIKLQKYQISTGQANKIKSVIAVKHDAAKKELQEMRAKMLEIQRQKMEDRERKKLESTKIKNI